MDGRREETNCSRKSVVRFTATKQEVLHVKRGLNIPLNLFLKVQFVRFWSLYLQTLWQKLNIIFMTVFIIVCEEGEGEAKASKTQQARCSRCRGRFSTRLQPNRERFRSPFVNLLRFYLLPSVNLLCSYVVWLFLQAQVLNEQINVFSPESSLSVCFVCQVLNKEEQELAAKNEYNFDHPDAFDFELLVTVLRKLKKGKSVKVPVYDFTSHCRRKEWVRRSH